MFQNNREEIAKIDSKFLTLLAFSLSSSFLSDILFFFCISSFFLSDNLSLSFLFASSVFIEKG